MDIVALTWGTRGRCERAALHVQHRATRSELQARNLMATAQSGTHWNAKRGVGVAGTSRRSRAIPIEGRTGARAWALGCLICVVLLARRTNHVRCLLSSFSRSCGRFRSWARRLDLCRRSGACGDTDRTIKYVPSGYTAGERASPAAVPAAAAQSRAHR